ncbi:MULTISPECIES: protein-glutamate methylesterase/protein-glutamine glutaminase [Virgibacillus]|uniref:Protein-glutamate methylesterase/protein-glutamine glutaminase n=1 Tax=Virgibacillus pantothenticus TaxID=1473 RepID=A0A0L0QNS6_VIRPA|nr:MULTISPECIES: chemotaxis response regulator protein-glutamate methylesterase [Virgibacillus]API93905.1 chemotaxis response regulator protein-glutamate methylesterase [Virgibacillus sp. 6R]KNE20189.1 chemotaxis protein CheY [Virgibacillus pantothenticus]MBS7427551.1 chemotaxis response regulator protein-glutamate methylesterase [Virgibacillus sp. 19R1-5]MBU8565959.1 chemotaxis response regulator protein-glutamate methylesterase [Virgibacillus pantothenticus]MBU8600936.1 chemotaxis response r
MNIIRVLVIDDSAFMRKILSDMLASDPRIEVVGTARNGEDGLHKIKQLSPDVITLDVQMPVMDGITALKEIMQTHPIPVVMLSSVTEDATIKTIQAISSGAVDFIAKPSGAISIDIETMKQEIIHKVITASMVKLPRQQKASKKQIPIKEPIKELANYHQTIVAIGASTGGPRALQHIVEQLPKNLAAAVLVVQHMPAGFTKSLAERLNLKSELLVKEAEHGERLQHGVVYIAPGGWHMKLSQIGTSIFIDLTEEDPLRGHRPSVDMLFTSVAPLQEVNKIAVILTGMGNDGTDGIKNLKKSDDRTYVIAESEETAIVYGMPKAAMATNLVNKQVPLDEVSRLITKLV